MVISLGYAYRLYYFSREAGESYVTVTGFELTACSALFLNVRSVYCGTSTATYTTRGHKHPFLLISMFYRAFFNSIIDKRQHMHFFTFKTVLV